VPKLTGPRFVSAEEAAKAVKSGMRIRFPVGHNVMGIADQIAARYEELSDVEVTHTSAPGNFAWCEPGLEDTFSVVQEHWAAQPVWPAMKERRMDYLPMPFSLRFKADWDERPSDQRRPADVVCVQVSPPDADGMVNVGRHIWDAPEYMRHAEVVIAEVCPDMPRLAGDGNVPADLVTHFIDEPGVPVNYAVALPAEDEHRQMAKLVADLIEDGDTLQMGVGAAVFMSGPIQELLAERNDLGWHSEATPFGIPDLIKAGVITSKYTDAHPGVCVAANWPVEPADREWMEQNPKILGHEIWKVTNPTVVASIKNFKAINSVIMIDLTGQAAAESIGTKMHSGVGGLLEFMVGSLWSPGGRSILVSQARDASGTRSRIVPILPEGTQVSVPRTLADTVVTEYGVANLFGKTARERAAELIRIAAPEFREELTAASRALFYP
jgi:4-hydroxybutyrate CoA-transferase